MENIQKRSRQESVAYQNIISFADLCEEEFIKLLNLVEAEQSLKGLYLVLDNLQRFYAVVTRDCTKEYWDTSRAVILETRAVCNQLIEQKATVREKLASVTLKEIRQLIAHLGYNFDRKRYTTTNLSFWGIKGKNPLWTTLGYVNQEGDYSTVFAQLQAFTFLSLVALRQYPDPSLLLDSKEAALKALRVLADDPKSAELSLLPKTLKSPEEFVRLRAQFPEAEELNHIADVIEDALDYLTHRNGIQFQRSLGFGPNDVYPPGFDIEGHLKGVMPGGDVSAVLVDICPARRTATYKDPRVHKQIAKAIAKNNQHFPFGLNRLSRRGIRALLKTLNDRPEKFEETTVHAALNVMFWLGWDERRLSKIEMGPNADRCATDRIDDYNPETGVMHIYSPYPCLKTPISSDAAKQLHPRFLRLTLQFPEMAIKALTHYLKNCPRETGQRLFPWKPEEILLRCKSSLKTLNQDVPVSITIKRLQTHIPHLLRRQEMGDAAIATLITGSEIPGGQTRVHYLSTDAYLLAEFYKRVTNDLLQNAGYQTAQASSPPQEDCHIGTPKRPYLKTVQDVVTTLIGELHGN